MREQQIVRMVFDKTIKSSPATMKFS